MAKKCNNKAAAPKAPVAPAAVKEVKKEEVKVAPVKPAAKPVAKKAPAKKPAAKKPVAKKDNKVQVEFSIEVKDANVNTIYVCGNAKEIGNWDAAKALEIKKNADGMFVAKKGFDANTTVEFKVLQAKDWAKVEKGMQCEEIQNHTVYVVKDAKAELVVYNWSE